MLTICNTTYRLTQKYAVILNMRKNIIAIAFITLTTISYAQNWFYHNVGDTIHGYDSIYFTNFRYDTWLNDTNSNMKDAFYFSTNGNDLGGEKLMRFYTPTPLKIIGLAAAVSYGDGVSIYYDQSIPRPDQEYLLLYDAEPDTLELKKSAPWNHYDPHRIFEFDCRNTRIINNSCVSDLRYFRYAPLYECYFEDKPVIVTDSFYVGVTFHTWRYILDPETPFTWNSTEVYYIRSSSDMADTTLCDKTPYFHYIFRPEFSSLYSYMQPGNNYHSDAREYYIMFPIIELDTLPPDTVPYVCPRVDTLRLADRSDNQALLMWDANQEHQAWQICLSPEGDTIGSGLLDTIISQQFFQLSDIDSNDNRTAYVRAICQHRNQTYFSQWSNGVPLKITPIDPPDSTSVLLPDNTQNIRLVPNPASKSVTISSNSNLSHLQAFDIKGLKILDMPIYSNTTIDISDWNPGIYILIIHSDKGVASRRLVVK